MTDPVRQAAQDFLDRLDKDREVNEWHYIPNAYVGAGIAALRAALLTPSPDRYAEGWRAGVEEAARSVDCDCDNREQAIAAKTSVERALSCRHDLCCARDAAAIRSLAPPDDHFADAGNMVQPPTRKECLRVLDQPTAQGDAP